MAFAHAKNFSNRRKMDFLIDIVHGKETIENALLKIKSGDKLGFDFINKEWEGIQDAVIEIPNYSFLAEKLFSQGVDIVHIMEKYVYPKILKENLKKDAPIVIYTKGNADLLNKNSVAIVGSRNCSEISLEFTNTVAMNAVRRKSVIVSGFAKGIDKQALDSALTHKGQSIIVLPQGIETYKAKTYYPETIRGDVLFISTYHPKAPWSVGLAMDRNKIIYGLAKEIYAAEAGDSGGTWEGVMNGIKRGRKVFVRMASASERNANNLLISKGAIAVDTIGNVIENLQIAHLAVREPNSQYEVPTIVDITDNEIIEKVIDELKSRMGKGIMINDIIDLLQLDKKTSSRIIKLLTANPTFSISKKGRANYYNLSNLIPKQSSIF